MDIYLQEDLDKFVGAAPYFTHPYQHWKNYKLCVDALLGKMADELQNAKGFCERLKQARNNVKDPLDFFSFTTELKVAHFLHSNKFEPEFIKAKSVPLPDFKLNNGFFVEVHAPTKYFAALFRAEEELQKLDDRFRFKRRIGLPPSCQINWNEYWPKLKTEVTKWAGKKLNCNPQVLVGNWENENLVAELVDDSLLQDADTNNAHGDPENTSMTYLNEAIRNKTECADGKIRLKNGLDNSHPNLLWLEFLFLQEELLVTNCSQFDLFQNKMPAGLDSIVVSVCGIDRGYQDAEILRLLLNNEICTESRDSITQWFNSLNWSQSA